MSKPLTVYLDESGYTGPDLLNPEQPIFTVASVDLEDALARTILQTSFPNYRANEFKFTRVLARPSHRNCLVAFSERLSAISNSIFVVICDKKFATFAKATDLLIEPLAHDLGLDFYADGFVRRYVNTFYHAVHTFSGTSLYDVIVHWYDRFSRNPSEQGLKDLRSIEASCPERVRPFMSTLLSGAEYNYAENSANSLLADNDIQASCVLSSLGYWRSRANRELRIVHDDSSNFFRQLPNWDLVTSSDVRPETITYEEGRTISFPMRVAQTVRGNSAECHSLQFCDMIAGLAAYLSRQSTSSNLGIQKEIVEAGFGLLNGDAIRPGSELIDHSPRQLDGPDVIDQFVRAVSRRRKPSL